MNVGRHYPYLIRDTSSKCFFPRCLQHGPRPQPSVRAQFPLAGDAKCPCLRVRNSRASVEGEPRRAERRLFAAGRPRSAAALGIHNHVQWHPPQEGAPGWPLDGPQPQHLVKHVRDVGSSRYTVRPVLVVSPRHERAIIQLASPYLPHELRRPAEGPCQFKVGQEPAAQGFLR